MGGTLSDGTVVTPKYVGSRRLMEVAVTTLATDRALLLLGVPGTAKSWVSEHLAAAVSGDSTLMVQGTSGTAEESIRYGWNYARLLAEGPSEGALVPSPVMVAMRTGAVARIEELTRIPSDVQDALITVLSEKTLPVPELGTEVQAARGFNVVATANDRDRGVNDPVLGAAPALQHRGAPAAGQRGGRGRHRGQPRGVDGRRPGAPGAAPGAGRADGDPPRGRGLPGAALRGDPGRPDPGQVTLGHPVDGRGHLGGDRTAWPWPPTSATGGCAPRTWPPAWSGAVVKDPVADRVVWNEYLEVVAREREGWSEFYAACRDEAT